MVSGKLTQKLRSHIKHLTRGLNGPQEDSPGIIGLVNWSSALVTQFELEV